MRKALTALLLSTALLPAPLVAQPAAGTRSTKPAEAATLEREAAVEWAKVSRTAKEATDIAAITDALEAFLAKYGTTANAAQAKTDLAHYKDLAAAGAVKFQGKWTTLAEKKAVTDAWRAAAKPAIDAYREGKWRAALLAARAVLDKDKTNQDALAVGGLASFRLADITQARIYFNTLNTAADPTAFTENNLGVFSFEEKRYPDAILHFYKALQLSPDDDTVIDNAIVSLSFYDEAKGPKTAPTYTGLTKLLDASKKRQDDAMAPQNLVRDGIGFIPRAEMEKRNADIAEMQKTLKSMQTQFDLDRAEIVRLENQIQNNKNTYDSAQRTIAQVDQRVAARGPGVDYANLQSIRDSASKDASRAQSENQRLIIQHDKLQNEVNNLISQRDPLLAKIKALTPRDTAVKLIDYATEEAAATAAPAATKPVEVPATKPVGAVPGSMPARPKP